MRIVLGVEYDGSHFCGFQFQRHVVTVQGHLETALSSIAHSAIKLYCAGRTDQGVHALAQVVHFDTEVKRPIKAWVEGTNAHLKKSVRVHWARFVSKEFHARFSALSRQYRYIIANTRVRPAILSHYLAWHKYPLDETLMHAAAQCLVGEHDFSAFRSSECNARTPIRNIQAIAVKREKNFVIIEIKANAFLHRMVRIIVGNLLAVGDNRRPIHSIKKVLESKQRILGAETAEPCGLYLVNVQYPEHFNIPPFNNRCIILQ